jgi:hypothetical protein
MKKLPIALGLALAFAVAGCSSGSSGGGGGTTTPPATTPTTPAATQSTAVPAATDAASQAAATKVIKTNWATFFKTSTPHATAVGMLQDGASLGPAVKDAAKIAKAGKTNESAKVKKVVFSPDGTSATVTYTLYGNGNPILKNTTGVAVLEDGQWKVSKITFCTLVGLGASSIGLTKIPGCQ